MIKYIVMGINLAVLFSAIACFLAGMTLKKEGLGSLAAPLFGVWLGLDFLTVILAFYFGWFAT